MMYLIVEDVIVYIPGDERSRECPGHGYSAHTETYKNVIICHDKEGLLAQIKHRDRYPGGKPYKIYECNRELKIVKTVDF
jgi:hypothetical protein